MCRNVSSSEVPFQGSLSTEAHNALCDHMQCLNLPVKRTTSAQELPNGLRLSQFQKEAMRVTISELRRFQTISRGRECAHKGTEAAGLRKPAITDGRCTGATAQGEPESCMTGCYCSKAQLRLEKLSWEGHRDLRATGPKQAKSQWLRDQ